MRGFQPWAALTCVVIIAITGCSKPKAFKPARPLPPGTLLIHFTSQVEGPIELIIDGVRVPVATPKKKKKKTQNLVISGLEPGGHRYFLSSPREAFGPDHDVVDLPADRGIFIVNFAQRFNSVLYGTSEPMPPAPGIPGVNATLEP